MNHLRRFLLAFTIALALVAGQQAVALHGLEHATEELAQHDGAPAPATCADHALYVSVASALGADAPVAPFVAAVIPEPGQQAIREASLPVRYSFHSRAPPAASPA